MPLHLQLAVLQVGSTDLSLTTFALSFIDSCTSARFVYCPQTILTRPGAVSVRKLHFALVKSRGMRHFCPSCPALLMDEDPIPLYALKLLAGSMNNCGAEEEENANARGDEALEKALAQFASKFFAIF